MNIIETNLKFRTALTNRNSTNRIIIHHAEASHCTAQDIHQWHLNNGWSGAGYHFLVRKDGTVYRLRPEGKIGAHASGSNSDSIFKFHCDSINMFGKQADFAEKWHLNSTVILLIYEQ